jgi:general secretion pathway protein I
MSLSANERNRRRGFTLIEVLVAFAILAVALTALFQVFSSGLGAIGTAERHSMAAMLARSILDDVGAEIPLAVGEQRGELDDGFSWLVRIERSAVTNLVADGGELYIPYDVTVEISWGHGRALSLTTLRVGLGTAALEQGIGPTEENNEESQ